MKAILVSLFVTASISSWANTCLEAGRSLLPKGHLKPVVVGERIVEESGNFDHVADYVKRHTEGKIWDPLGVIGATIRVNMITFLKTLDVSMEVALAPSGPFMSGGPLARRGPISDRSWSPNHMWVRLVESGLWNLLPPGMRFLFEWGPTSLYGPAGPWGAKRSLYTDKVGIVESYSENYVRSARVLDTSYTAVLENAVGQKFNHRSDRDQLVTVSVTPFAKDSPHFVEVRDSRGQLIAESKNDVEKNVIVVEVAKGTEFTVQVFGENAQTHRLTVIGAGRTIKEFQADPFFGPMVEFLGLRRAIRMLVVFGPFGELGPGGPLGPFGDMGAVPSRMKDANLELLPTGQWRNRQTGEIVRYLLLFSSPPQY